MQMTAKTRLAAFRFAGLLFVVLASSANAAGQNRGPTDFLERRMTPCDFIDPSIAQFEHGTEATNAAEDRYLSRLRRHVTEKPFNVQKECAYDFMRLRRKVVETASTARSETAFDRLNDMKRHPAAYVGRPVVLYGRVGRVMPSEAGNRQYTAQLVALQTNDILATVDIVDPRNVPRQFPSTGFPVRVVGFLVKTLTGNVPYVCTHHLEFLQVEADPAAYSAVRHKTRGIRPEEASAYYETLSRSRILPLTDQQQYANAWLKARIEQRLESATKVHTDERRNAEQVRLTDQTKATDLVRAADGKFTAEQRRHDEYAADPGKFPIFADVFMNPNVYLGKPVTMRGHVRKVMSYPADVDRFGGGELHELWLFTNDSQQNPAVVVCSELPANFPTGDEIVEGVSVTGYFFKLYRYAADDANRAAPMLLASQVEWTPVTNSYAGFGSFGTLATVLAMFAGVMLVMYMWSNHEGDRRAREALTTARDTDANITAERPVRFQSPDLLPASSASRPTTTTGIAQPVTRQQPLPPRSTVRQSTVRGATSTEPTTPPLRSRRTTQLPPTEQLPPTAQPQPRRRRHSTSSGIGSLPGGPRAEQPLPPRGAAPMNPIPGDGLIDSMTGAAGRVGDYAGDQADRAKDYLGDKAARAGDYMSDTVGRAADATGNVTDAVGRAGNFLGDKVGQAGNYVTGQADRVGDAIGDSAGRVGDFVGRQKDSAGDFVGRQAGKFAAAAGAAGAFIAGSQHGQSKDNLEPVKRPLTGNQIHPDYVIGSEILRVLEPNHRTEGSRIELSSGNTLVLTNDVISLEDSRSHDGRSDRQFQRLEGSRISRVAVDQWERVYLLVGRDTFVTEDFAENGQRCLIFGELSSLIAEEPDLTLRDYWTKSPIG